MRRRGHQGFTLIELLVVLAITSILMGLLLAAIQRAREAASRIECGNNLKQLGLALHMYNDSYSSFPLSWNGTYDPEAFPTFYTSILPFIEQGNQNVRAPLPIKLFFCPSRRDTNVGPKDDYGLGYHPTGWADLPLNGWLSILGGPSYPGPFSEQFFGGVGLNQVTNADGTSSTLLLAHKAMAPNYYYRGDPFYINSDNDWPGSGNGSAADFKRDPRYFVRDVNSIYIWKYIGSPHPDVMPSLFADGSVRSLSYATNRDIIPRLWAWNDGAVFPNDSF